MSFPGGSEGKESACNAGDSGLISGSVRSPGGGHGNLFQYSCLENPMDRGGSWATVHTVHGVTKSCDGAPTHTYGLSTGLPSGSAVKNPLAHAGDTDWIPGWGRSPGEGNGNTLRSSCLGNPMDRGASHGYSPWVTKSQT